MIIALYLGFFVYLVYPHELGHYLAARISGVPSGRLSIRMFTFPQHVALRNEDRWVGPREHQLYRKLCWEYLVTAKNVIRFVAGGLAFGTVFFLIGTAALRLMGREDIAIRFVYFSIVFNSIYFAFEMVLYILFRRIFGDFSGLFALSKRTFISITSWVLVAHFFAYYIAIS
jgi:hypothetical protein